MAEIVAVLNKYDVAGIALLQSKTHGEWLNHVLASWACTSIEMDDKGETLRLKANLSDYPSKEAHHEAVRLTVSMLFGLHDGAKRIQENMNAVMEMLGGHMDIDHISKFDR